MSENCVLPLPLDMARAGHGSLAYDAAVESAACKEGNDNGVVVKTSPRSQVGVHSVLSLHPCTPTSPCPHAPTNICMYKIYNAVFKHTFTYIKYMTNVCRPLTLSGPGAHTCDPDPRSPFTGGRRARTPRRSGSRIMTSTWSAVWLTGT